MALRIVGGLLALATLTGCGQLANGLNYFASAGLVDEYSIPQNRSLAVPTDFSRLPEPKNPEDRVVTAPSQNEIEALVFSVEPIPEPEASPLTLVTGSIEQYRPIGTVISAPDGFLEANEFINDAPAVPFSVQQQASQPQPLAAAGSGVTALSPQDVAALSALAVGAPVSTSTATLMTQPAAAPAGLQTVTSLPAGVSVVGDPVVLPR